MNEITKRKTTTYDAVETALELSKESGTWEELIRSKGAKPWLLKQNHLLSVAVHLHPRQTFRSCPDEGSAGKQAFVVFPSTQISATTYRAANVRERYDRV